MNSYLRENRDRPKGQEETHNTMQVPTTELCPTCKADGNEVTLSMELGPNTYHCDKGHEFATLDAAPKVEAPKVEAAPEAVPAVSEAAEIATPAVEAVVEEVEAIAPPPAVEVPAVAEIEFETLQPLALSESDLAAISETANRKPTIEDASVEELLVKAGEFASAEISGGSEALVVFKIADPSWEELKARAEERGVTLAEHLKDCWEMIVVNSWLSQC